MRKNRHLSFWELAEIIPPIRARLLARIKSGRPLYDAEISQASGLSADKVFLLSHMTTWETVDLVTMRRFLIGCRIDFCNSVQMERIKNYLRHKPTYKYLRTSPEWKTRYEPLLRRYVKSTKPNP